MILVWELYVLFGHSSLYKPIKKNRVGDQQEQKFNVPINLDSITFLLSLQYCRLYSFRPYIPIIIIASTKHKIPLLLLKAIFYGAASTTTWNCQYRKQCSAVIFCLQIAFCNANLKIGCTCCFKDPAQKFARLWVYLNINNLFSSKAVIVQARGREGGEGWDSEIN